MSDNAQTAIVLSVVAICVAVVFIAVAYFIYDSDIEHIRACKEMVQRLSEQALAISECSNLD